MNPCFCPFSGKVLGMTYWRVLSSSSFKFVMSWFSYPSLSIIFFRFILQHGGRALLADEMGLGKTLQANDSLTELCNCVMLYLNLFLVSCLAFLIIELSGWFNNSVEKSAAIFYVIVGFCPGFCIFVNPMGREDIYFIDTI